MSSYNQLNCIPTFSTRCAPKDNNVPNITTEALTLQDNNDLVNLIELH